MVRDQVLRGLVYGWYFMPAALGPINVAESIVDLHDLHCDSDVRNRARLLTVNRRDLHTVSRRVLEHLVAQGNRVARFITPYREHLAQQFTVTYSRIGLPEPFESVPWDATTLEGCLSRYSRARPTYAPATIIPAINKNEVGSGTACACFGPCS